MKLIFWLTGWFNNRLMPLFLMGCCPVDVQEEKRLIRVTMGKGPSIKVGKRPLGNGLSAAFYVYAVRRINQLTLAFALHFPAFECLRSTRLLASFLCKFWYTTMCFPNVGLQPTRQLFRHTQVTDAV